MASGYASHNAKSRGGSVANSLLQAIGWIAVAVLVGAALAILGNWRLWGPPIPATPLPLELIPVLAGSAWFIVMTAFALGALVRSVGLALLSGASLVVSNGIARQWDGEFRFLQLPRMAPDQFRLEFSDALLFSGFSVPLVLVGTVFAVAGSLWRTQPTPIRQLALLPPVALLLVEGWLNLTDRVGWFYTEIGVLQLVLAGLLLLSLRIVATISTAALATGAALLLTLLVGAMVFGYGSELMPDGLWQFLERVGRSLGF